jgi:hypothetical protein
MKAFPSAEPIYSKDIVGVKESTGMDLRDYFAAKAMQAIIGNSDQASLEVGEVDNWVGDYAYVVADAMMEARERK